MADLFGLNGRTAFVTGASRGLGRAVALGLAEAGADLIVAARDQAKLDEVAGEIRAMGRHAETVALELGDLDDVERAAGSLRGRPIDILVNNAGIADWGKLETSTLAAWQRMFDVNVASMYLLCRELSAGMAERSWGRIINFASYVAQTGRPNLSAYVASKHAVLGLTRAIAAEFATRGVTCNAIAPGFFKTDMAAPTVGHPQRSRIFRDAIAMNRFGDPAEIVGPVLFLASEASSYVTGHMLSVDGGVAGMLSLPVVVEA